VEVNKERCAIPIHLRTLRLALKKGNFKEERTGAKRVVGTPELLARCKIFAFSCDAFEVICVVLEACVVESGE
jgi:hypothetical protein